MHDSLSWWISGPWLVLLLYWGLAALRLQPAKQCEAPLSRLRYSILILAAFLLFSYRPQWGPLSWRFLPDQPAVFFASVALTMIGVCFAIWARAHLGDYWSGAVTIKQEHRLIRTGPYALVRHPIYTGIWLGMLGTAVAIGELRGLLAVGLAEPKPLQSRGRGPRPRARVREVEPELRANECGRGRRRIRKTGAFSIDPGRARGSMKRWGAVLVRVTVCSLSFGATAGAARADAWSEDALVKEADYIVNCSYTEYARNSSGVQSTDDAYGALNVLRIADRGPDWVRPGEAAMGVIGLMAGAIQLKATGHDITRYDQVMDRFFHTWIATRTQPFNVDPTSVDYGGVYERIYYDPTGKWQHSDRANAGVTGQLIAAMWKYYEYNLAVGNTQQAAAWLQQAWPLARLGGDFIQRNIDPTYQLVHSNAGAPDLWVSDASYAAMALRCLDAWGRTVTKDEALGYDTLADGITASLQDLKDDSSLKNFYRYRDGNSPTHALTYGDRIDQLCFLPYEADVLDPGEPFAASISDWWTNGSQGIAMTYQTPDTSDWRYFGTRLRYFFSGAAENNHLFAGAALQLAKVEWKHAAHTGDPTTRERARQRFEWVRSVAYSDLWMGATGATEANVPSGLVDWRDTTDYTNTAGDWARFVDTSGNFIEVVLMLDYGVDTRYVPD